jgi:hypothetical protein
MTTKDDKVLKELKAVTEEFKALKEEFQDICGDLDSFADELATDSQRGCRWTRRRS